MSGLLVESREARRIIGQLVRGERLIERLLAVCEERHVRAGTIVLGGVLESVSLAHHDHASRASGKPRRVRTPVQILAGGGMLSERDGRTDLRLQAVVSREGDNGIEVLGGVITEATVLACEYVIEALDDVLLRQTVDRRTGLPIWFDLVGKDHGGAAGAAPQPPASQPATRGDQQPQATQGRPAASARQEPAESVNRAPAVAAGASLADRWAVAAAASEAAQQGPDPSTEPAAKVEPAAEVEPPVEPYKPMRVGDIIEHTKFGRCVIERIDANEEFATVRLRNQRIVRLNIDVLNLRYLHEADGKQVFTQ